MDYHDHKHIKSEKGKKLLKKTRDICMKFPEVEEQVDKFGHTSFRVKDKPFVMLGENLEEPSISIKMLKTTQEMLLQQDGYTKTPYIGQHGWTSFDTNSLNWNEIEDYILEGYLRTAPKSLIKQVQQ
ncbi:MmcQ/YjbR family DNA-binding protein [Alkalihalobacillus sp. AL-G]|uniref:MmcQ/YjbR family DNA-binding protein n=1 Tax=Alkalihalobacillus sp. AL-G TaxID=2926399 RepID=UPI002729E499|nr:MmcQ/YjbR family DNA-binding protein [Alkalihalobacillus sp. AL-G]WLD94325.1 MmcQ/YjbR family DNA-binding protein [Alkalihalobacillus sp. AL-G]